MNPESVRGEKSMSVVAALGAVLWTAVAPAGAIADQAPGPVEIAIDVRPGSAANDVNPRSRGTIPVAILGSETFDVGHIDVTTLEFGPGKAIAVHDLGDAVTYREHLRDVNGDGIPDLVVHFRAREARIACGETSVLLRGEYEARVPCLELVSSGSSSESDTVSVRQGPEARCDSAVIDVVTSRVAGLYAASFTLRYPRAVASFEQASIENSVLAADGTQVAIQTAESRPGALLVGITRLGADAGIPIADGLLIHLTFDRIADSGTGPLDFEDAELLDGSLPPQGIPGITWHGGTLAVEETPVRRAFVGSGSITTEGCPPPSAASR